MITNIYTTISLDVGTFWCYKYIQSSLLVYIWNESLTLSSYLLANYLLKCAPAVPAGDHFGIYLDMQWANIQAVRFRLVHDIKFGFAYSAKCFKCGRKILSYIRNIWDVTTERKSVFNTELCATTGSSSNVFQDGKIVLRRDYLKYHKETSFWVPLNQCNMAFLAPFSATLTYLSMLVILLQTDPSLLAVCVAE